MGERKLTHGREQQTTARINISVGVLAANFITTCFMKPKIRVGGWTRPRNGYVKLTVYAGFYPDSLEGSVGVVIRDHNGNFVAAANEKHDIYYDAFTTETVAVRFGLNLARTAGCNKIEVN